MSYTRHLLLITLATTASALLATRNILPPLGSARLYELASGVTIRPYGFVSLIVHGDSRQILGSREFEALLLPKPRKLDPNGNDIHAHPLFHMTAIDTRLGIALDGPNWETIKNAAIFEVDLKGPRGSFVRITADAVGLRHAFGTMTWKTGSFLYGQFWHPLVIPDCWPEVLDFNGGAPIEFLARSPQLRITQQWGNCEFIGAVATQRDFQSPGPKGLSISYIANAIIPNLHFQMRTYFATHFAGIAVDYKRLVPDLETSKGFKTDEHVDSVIVAGYMRINYQPISIRLKAAYAQNAADLTFLGGYAVKSQDPATGRRTFTPTAAASAWIDATYILPDDRMSVGVFAGYAQNLGASEDLHLNPKTKEPIIFALLDNKAKRVANVARISPRFTLLWDPFFFGVELEYTRAAWGRPNRQGRVIHTHPTDNVRLFVSLDYRF